MTDSEQQTFTVTGDSRICETYNSALQHDIAKIPADAWCVSVVNDEMYGITSVTDAQLPALGPPRELFESFKDTRDELEGEGMDRVTAHNTAWDRVDFESSYRTYLDEHWQEPKSPVHEACETLLVEATERPVAVVCYEGDDKNCHRHVLQSFLMEKHPYNE